jgi:hypothetical protein
MQSNYPPSIANNVAELAPVFRWAFAGDGGGGAATPVAEVALGTVGPGPEGIPLGSVLISPSAALTASDTNYATITVSKRTAGGSPVTIATATTKTSGGGGTGSWAAWTNVTIPAVAGAFVTPGDVITVSTAKASSGVVLPALTLEGFVTLN